MADAAMAISSGMRSRAAKSRNHVEKAVEEDGEGAIAPAAYAAGSGGRRVAPVVAVAPRFASVAVRASEPALFSSLWSRSIGTAGACACGAKMERAGALLGGACTRRAQAAPITMKAMLCSQTSKQTGKCVKAPTQACAKREEKDLFVAFKNTHTHTNRKKKEKGSALSVRPALSFLCSRRKKIALATRCARTRAMDAVQ